MSARPAVYVPVATMPMRHEPLRRWLPILRANLWRFDLASLLALLGRIGVRRDELRFASHTGSESAPRLIHDIEVVDDPRQVRLTLSFGLLGPQSPLPSYFFAELDHGTLDAAAFARFIGYFDHVVLSRLVAALHPELDDSLQPMATQKAELQLLDLRSAATLHWLFQQVFPELDVHVEPIRKARQLRTSAFRLGEAALGGEGTFGSHAAALGPGSRVTLFSDNEIAGSGQPWPLEVRARLQQSIAPLLRPLDVALETFLVLREQQSWAQLDHKSHLGYDTVGGAAARQRRIKVYDTSQEDNR